MTNAYEAVYLRFRGSMCRLPLISFAAVLRRDVDGAAEALEILIHGPPERWSRTDSVHSSLPDSRESRDGGKGGAIDRRTVTVGPESIGTMGPNDIHESFDPNRSERRARAGDDVSDDDVARRIAIDLGDEENVLAIRKLVGKHDRDQLDRALRRALAVPASRIRTSRAALFTTIVRQLAEHASSRPRP